MPFHFCAEAELQLKWVLTPWFCVPEQLYPILVSSSYTTDNFPSIFFNITIFYLPSGLLPFNFFLLLWWSQIS